MSDNNFSSGDVVKVTKELNGHQFEIGQEVQVYKVKDEYLLCSDGENQYGLTTDEVERLS